MAVLPMIGSAPAFAQANRPTIVRARVYVDHGFIASDLTSRNLFSEQIVGTVQSGLPAVVELLFKLVNADEKMVNGGVRLYELGYDVWDDRYLVKGADSTRYYTSFSKMGAALEQLRSIKLIPVGDVDGAGEYSLRFSVTVHPLRSRDRAQMVEWMGQNVTGEIESSRKQMLNLNDMIRHFFSREKEVTNRSPWFETEFFRPGALPDGREERR